MRPMDPDVRRDDTGGWGAVGGGTEGVDGPNKSGHDGFGLGCVTARATDCAQADRGGFIRGMTVRGGRRRETPENVIDCSVLPPAR